MTDPKNPDSHPRPVHLFSASGITLLAAASLLLPLLYSDDCVLPPVNPVTQQQLNATHTQITHIATAAVRYYEDSLDMIMPNRNPSCSRSTPSNCWPQDLEAMVSADYLEPLYTSNIWRLRNYVYPDSNRFAINIVTPDLEVAILLASDYDYRVLLDNTNIDTPSVTLIIDPPSSPVIL